VVDVGAGLARRINEVIVSAFINRASATAGSPAEERQNRIC